MRSLHPCGILVSSDTLPDMPIDRKLRCIRAFGALVAAGLTVMAGLRASGAQATAGGNAAEAWRRAFPLLAPKDEQHNPGGLLTAEEWDVVHDSSDGLGFDPGRDDRVRLLVTKLQPAFDALDEAAAQKRCDFGLDRSQGFGLLLPHLSRMRQAMYLMRLKADIQMADGDIEGMVRTQGQMASMALQPGQDAIIISALVGQAMSDHVKESIRDAVDQGSLNREGAKQLLQELAPLRANDPFHVADSVRGEYGSLEAELRNAVRGGMDGEGFLRHIGAPEGTPAADPAVMLEALPSLEPMFDLQAQAAREPDAQKSAELARKARKMLDALRGPASTLRAVLPAIDGVIARQKRSAADLESLAALLKRLADDPEAVASLRSPALLWARIAARVNAIPDDRQDGVELVRATGPKEGDQVVEAGVACLQGCRDGILADMAQAAAIERRDIDFEKVRGVRGIPPLATLGGMRGAARLALADAWLGDAEHAVDRIDLAAAAVQALAADPHQASSCMALAAARDLVPAVRRAVRLPGLGADQRERLKRAIERVDRSDPFGFKASLRADRRWLLDSFRGRCEPTDPEEMEKALRRRAASWVMSAAIEWHDQVPEPHEDAGPLVDVADVFPIDKLRELRQASRLLVLAVDPPDGAPDRKHATLRALPVPVLRDPAMDAAEAQAVLSQLDAALRGE
jgi:hypothetical protein